MSEIQSIPWYQRLSTKLIAALTLSILLPLLLFYIISDRTATRELLAEAAANLAEVTERSNDSLASFLMETAVDLRTSPVEPDPLSLEERDLTLYLSYLLRLKPAMDSISLVTADGREKARISRTEVVLPDELRDMAESEAMVAIRENRFYFGDTSISSEGIPVVSVALPLGFELVPQGMLLARVSLYQLFHRIDRPAERAGIVYIVDSSGKVIAHPDFSLVLSGTDFSESPPVAASLNLPPGFQTPMLHYTNIQGENVEGMGRRNELLGWSIVAEVRRSEALGGVYTIRTAFAATFFAASILGIAASLLIGRRASGIVGAIQRAARDIGRGDFSRELHLSGTPELAALSDDFNVMAGKLKDYQAHVERDVEVLNEMVRKRTQSLQGAYDELAKRERELRETQSALVQTEKLASLGQLVAGVVHEVNNPLSYIWNDLSVMRGHFQTLRRLGNLSSRFAQTDDPAARQQLGREIAQLCEEEEIDETLEILGRTFERTTSGLESIRKIISDLRDFSRMGKAEREPTDLNKTIQSTLTMLKYDIRSKGIEVETDLAELPLVECSAVKISQVLLNIILNAVQAVRKNGRIWITSRGADDSVTILVRDDGPGIPEEIRDRIFDPFFTTKERGKGTGLGLSISYGIIREHNGSISLTSAPGAGAEFAITLPIRSAPMESADAEADRTLSTRA